MNASSYNFGDSLKKFYTDISIISLLIGQDKVRCQIILKMKRLSPTSVIAFGVFASLSLGATRPVMGTPYEPFCFLHRNGTTIDLTPMCQSTQPAQPITVTATRPELAGEALENALSTTAFAYADTYCEYKARGGTNRQAEEAARRAAAELMVGMGLSGDNLTAAWAEDAQVTSQALCPELQPTTRYR